MPESSSCRTAQLFPFGKVCTLRVAESKFQKCYTVILLDPDAPSPQAPTMRHWLHWLVVNVAHGDVSTVAKYAGPTPPEGRHRYVFLVYEQDEPFSRALVQGLPKQRAKFNLTHFVMLAGLKELVAVNFFYAEHPQ
ncbi:protein D2-like [Haemaphysalis longicornis]